MAEELPGFIPRVLQRGDVSLLRADEAVLKAMVDGWRAQMLARGLGSPGFSPGRSPPSNASPPTSTESSSPGSSDGVLENGSTR